MMMLRRCTISCFSTIAILLVSLALSACGQTGELYMPETYSKKPAPAPREPKIIKNKQTTSQTNTVSDTEKGK